MSADAARLLQITVDHTYEEFLARVAKGRGKTREAIDAIAQGRVWAGVRCQAAGPGRSPRQLRRCGERSRDARRTQGGYGVRRIEPELSWAQQLLFQVRSTGDRMLERIGLRAAAQRS